MLLNNILNKRFLILFVGCIVLVSIGFGVFSVFKSKATITVSGDHDATTNQILVNGEFAYPEGEEGRKYQASLRGGENEVVLRGPFIQTTTQQIDAGLLGDNQKIDITAKPRNIETILKELFQEPDATFRGTQYFSESGVIISFKIGTTLDEDEEENSYVVLVGYDKAEGEWKDITKEYTLNPDLYDLDANAINYLYELDSE